MKINEKNVCAFAVSATHIDREGWLEKRGEVNKGFQRRWFVLKGNILFYFEKQNDKEPLGCIVLEGCTVELAEDEEHYIFKIVFHGQGNRSYVLSAESQDSMEQWMKALASASYDYIKLMVNELQRQLDEIEELPTILDSSSIERVAVPKEGKSPNPPPRQRQNPFNKSPSIHEGAVTHHHRSHSLRVTSDPTTSGRSEPAQKTRSHFRELHNSYGRRVLADYNQWKHAKYAQIQAAQANTQLISF